MKKGGCVYIITNQYNKILFTGSTTLLRARIWEHKSKAFPNSFSAKYNCNKLVWYEVFPTIMEAIEKEKQIKASNRKNKKLLIEKLNPEWKDLFDFVQDL